MAAIKISKIKPNPNNPRNISDSKFNQLVKSIISFPKMMTLRPIILDENNITLGGNMRLRAIKKISELVIQNETFEIEIEGEKIDQLIFLNDPDLRTNFSKGEIPKSWVKKIDELNEEEKKQFIVKDNVSFGVWDWDILANEWDSEQLDNWALDIPIFEDLEDKEEKEDIDISDKLKETFEVIINCGNEEEQEATFDHLTKEGYSCRVLTL